MGGDDGWLARSQPVSAVAAAAVAARGMNQGLLPELQARLPRDTPLRSLEGSSFFAETAACLLSPKSLIESCHLFR